MVRGPQAFTAVCELLLTVLSWAGMREPGNGFLGPYTPQTGHTGIGLCKAFLLGVPCGSLARYPEPAIRGRMVCCFFVMQTHVLTRVSMACPWDFGRVSHRIFYTHPEPRPPFYGWAVESSVSV